VTVYDGSANGQDSLQATVLNVAPTLSDFPDLTVTAGQAITVTGVLTDPGWLDTHTVVITWSVGVTDTIALAAGGTAFSFTHIMPFQVNMRLSSQ